MGSYRAGTVSRTMLCLIAASAGSCIVCNACCIRIVMNATSCLVICVLETTNVERPLKAHSLKLDETGKFLNFAMFRMGNF